MSVYVVTGGAGFIGSNIVQRLLREEEVVRVVDDFSTGRRDNLVGIQTDIAVFEGSICDAGLLGQAFEGADYVLHQAALASVRGSVDDPLRTNEVNVAGTLKVLAAARDCDVKRVVYASSCAVYGDAPGQPKNEEMLPAPVSPYAVSKLAGEHYCAAFARVYGLETVSLRYFNVYGPRQDPNSQYAAVIPVFIRAVLEGERPRVFGDGEQSRDFVFVDDVVDANLRAARVPKAAGAVVNVGTGESHTLNEVLRLLGEIAGAEVEAEHDEPRPGDVRESQADPARAREVLGFRARVGFEEGLRKTVEWYEGKEATTFFLPGA